MRYRAITLCDGLIFPESPRWHRGAFYCCSIDEGTIYRIDTYGNKEIVLRIDDWLSGWAFAGPESDDIVLTSARKRKLLYYKESVFNEMADLSNISTYGLNDLVRSHKGVIFVGAVNFEFGKVDPPDMPNSPLIRVDRDGNIAVASDETGFANGMVISPDGGRWNLSRC